MKSGFTLMEIMVVIIVIAVLSSVGGPMVGSITNKGRESATRAKLSNLKDALLAYQSDVGRLPFTGNPKCIRCADAYCADSVLSYSSEEQNVLLSDNAELLGFGINRYKRKWKGPYMDSDPADFMYDAWGNPIHYVAKGKNLFLWSYGADQEPDNPDPSEVFANIGKEIGKTTEDGEETLNDDIIISVKKFKSSLK